MPWNLTTVCIDSNYSSNSPICTYNLLCNTITFLPILINNNHFCLYIINNNNKTFQYYNPFGYAPLESKLMQRKFIKFLNKLTVFCNLNIDEYVFVDPPNTIKQKDTYNCGVFVCFVMLRMSENLCTNIKFEPDKFRQKLMNYILLSSDDVTNVCLICDRNHLDNDWVQCECCYRWVHQVCSRITLTGISWANVKYMCKLCEKYSS